jgi:uncharacterized membrane protein YcaP (DUF421 family)
VLLADALNQEDLSQNEVFMGLRDKGVEYLGEVRRAYLEPSGHISVFKEKMPATMGASVLPDDGGKG